LEGEPRQLASTVYNCIKLPKVLRLGFGLRWRRSRRSNTVDPKGL